MRFVDTKYLITKHVVNPERRSIIICVDQEHWHKRAGMDTIKTDIVKDFHAILPSVSLQKLSRCISVTQPVTLKIENVSPHGYKEDYTPRKTLKIEIGKNLFLAAQSALLSEPENDQDNSKSSKPNCR